MILYHAPFYPKRKAISIVNQLNSDPEDDWTYKAVPVPQNKKGLYRIEVYEKDERGKEILVGCL